MLGTTLGRLRCELREFFLLDRARDRSAKVAGAQREQVWKYTRATKRRLLVARSLRDPGEAHAAALLCRSGAVLQLYAVLAARSSDVDLGVLGVDAALQGLDRVLDEDERGASRELESARRLVLAPDPIAIERLSAKEARQAVRDLERFTRWLSTLVEPRSPRRLRGLRIARLSLVGAVAAALLMYAVVLLASPEDLALRRTATSSSKEWETEPSGAVDGVKNGRFGFHSAEEDQPWLAIDLGGPCSIRKVKVYGRGDCCHDQSIPLALEISDDGHTYRKIGERSEAFSEKEPWTVEPRPPLQARFVRLRTERRSFLVLSEVEAFGERLK
jgi:hypothetical protein